MSNAMLIRRAQRVGWRGTLFGLWCGSFVLSMACAGGSDAWTGSVDAVFRYRPSENSTVVYEVRKGSTSEASGLMAGDQLIAIDGTDVSHASFQAVRDALRGPVGTMARITVKRRGEIVNLTVERLAISKSKE